MNGRYEPLFQPWQVGSVTIKNRFVLCPMEGTNMINWEAKTGFNHGVETFYRERAKDGIGLMIPGAIPMLSIVGSKWLYKHPEEFKPVRPLMDEIHSFGSKVFFQLTAGTGRSFPLPPMMMSIIDNKFLTALTKPFLGIDKWMVAPDEGSPNVWNPKYPHRQLTVNEIHQIVYAFGQTALLCKQAGVDGVEIHAVHEGYLLDQFTMPYTNHRTDEYGGSFENRYRFPVEIVQEIKRVCGKDFPVSLRYSVTSKTKAFNQGALPGEEFVEAGRSLEESEKAIAYLREAGYDMFNCDNGTYDAWYWAHPPVYMPLNTNLEEAAHIKKYTDAPIVCAGRMQAEEAADAIHDGRIDAMGLGRQFLCEEAYITKLKEDRVKDIRPCISCHAACLPLTTYCHEGCYIDLMNLHMGRCALNPRTLDESKYPVRKAKRPRKIAVIGGGIGGIEFALQASKRGHMVDLYEKTGELGGVFIAAAAPDFKEKDKQLLLWYKRELEKSSVAVHLNTEIADLSKLAVDEIVIATGARPRFLKVPGGEKAMTATQYLLRAKEVGDRVAVIGGGLTGCEIAYELALSGKHPFIVEMLNDLVKAPGVCAANSNMLRDELKFHDVPVYLESTVLEVTDTSVLIRTKDGNKEIAADTVITSIGYTAGTPLAAKSRKHLYIIGDASNVGNLKTAILSANDLVMKLSK